MKPVWKKTIKCVPLIIKNKSTKDLAVKIHVNTVVT